MDESVRAALARWPNVPSVYGWLSLDRRGTWLIKGERIGNPAVQEFIGRNYECDERGRWFFQNGPQRVFVTLAYLPYVLRTADNAARRLETHTGRAVEQVSSAWLDDRGGLVLRWSGGVGAIDDRDLAAVAQGFSDARGAPLADAALAKAIDPSTA
jgi:hypothetical protein